MASNRPSRAGRALETAALYALLAAVCVLMACLPKRATADEWNHYD